MRKTFHRRQSAKQGGLTLVELLIALVMGLVLLAGVVTVFIANKQTYRHQDALARLQENGRFAVNRLERDIRRAAATFGCVPGQPVNTLNSLTGAGGTCPSNTLTPIQGDPIQGIDDVSGLSIGGKAVKTGTDVLQILLGLGGQCRILDDNRPSAQMKVESTCGHLQDFDIVMVVSDLATCERGAVFQITNTNARVTGNNHHVETVHNTGRGWPGNCSKDIGPEFTDGYMVKIAYVNYFIADTGRGVPALYVFFAPGGLVQELVEGVEDMQLLYGVDTDSDSNRTVDAYWPANTLETNKANDGINYWERVRSVRFHLLLQSTDANALAVANPVRTAANVDDGPWNFLSTDFTDKRWRQVYSATVGVRGRLP